MTTERTEPVGGDAAGPTLDDGTPAKPRQGRIKCVVWDLDNTVWDGTLLEDGEVTVRPEVVEAIRTLDGRGILNSIASRNDHDAAMERLTALGLAEYFLYPQIGWNPKSSSIATIAERLNLGIDALAFVDDQPFELAEVSFTHPEVMCVDIAELPEALDRPELVPRFITDESRLRRRMYRSGAERERVEEEFEGTNEEFLASLGMTFTVAPAQEEDLKRAEELTVRTNQLNSTGHTFSYDELDAFRGSPDHLLLVADLTDRFGPYGKIGLALVEKGGRHWRLRLLLMSCRVMARGVGGVLLNHVMSLAHRSGAGLRADFVETGRNRQMYVTYKFAGFREILRDGDRTVLEADLSRIQEPPEHLTFRAGPEAG
ncbi:FkbH-like protein [Nocardiopsis mwathae]|uniref:FkbH-like protein n=1 Tax=Nocardiopsis mwathae TaxID=1472723 RepID=A0A7X0D505_9ACTN|nr:HAD-IIIC family phosphatase [Nocardiopsis mwathae]MBB6171872.1 FkbH-like protein [Nocardiopsis mwathae]